MTAKDQLHILNEKINKARREHQGSYVITIQDEIDIHLALKDDPKQIFPSDIEIMEEAISHARYGVEYKRDIELQVNIANFIKTKIHG